MSTANEASSTARKTARTAHVVIILDKSGSMESCRDATISGFNEYVEQVLQTAREEGLRTRVTLTAFNHEVRIKEFRSPLERLHTLDRHSYVPGGNTAMLDAVGTTLDRLLAEVRRPWDKTFLVCIVSDGYENASRRYSYTDIAQRIQRLTAEGNWTFTYLGSNQDLSKVAEQLNIPVGNVAAYTSSPAGTAAAWQRTGRAASRRMRDASRGVAAAQDYFSETDAS